jgi:hypothetical protein
MWLAEETGAEVVRVKMEEEQSRFVSLCIVILIYIISKFKRYGSLYSEWLSVN